MTPDAPSIHRLKWWILLAAAPLIAGAAQLDLPAFWDGFIGDSAVYYAMADSLAHDGDLRYTPIDLMRITTDWPAGPQGILLTADPNNPSIIHYAKPLFYSLIGAPLVRIAATNGLLILNALCFTALLFMGCLAFPEWETRRPWEIILWNLVFWNLSALPAYIFSLTPDLFNGTLVMAGLLPWIRHNHSHRPLRMLALSALILGIAAASRPPNALFLVLPLWSILIGPTTSESPGLSTITHQRLIHRLTIITCALLLFAAGIGFVYGLSHFLTGQGFAYSGFRKRIVGTLPFQTPGATFLNTGLIMSTESTRFVFNWDTVCHNARYFFIGRFAGLVPYFFPAFVSLLSVIPAGDSRSVRRPVLAVIAGLFLFHIIYIPSNWHGGSCAVGNRYLVAWLPAFFVLLRRPPHRRLIVLTALLTALLTGSIALNPASAFRDYRDTAKRPVTQAFPMEITLLESWPVDDLGHRRVEYGDHFAYFADDNQFGRENDGFWVRGKSRADMVIRCWKPAETVRLTIRNGGEAGRVSGAVGRDRFSYRAEAGEVFAIDMKPGPAVRSYNLAGNPSWCYPVRIEVQSGFIPRYSEPGSTDHRFLGCFVQIACGS
ncbi:hypothetical protein JXA80_13315 [bacterium]|nr:hypothetical protein [candidate division CSSED10-310 bacterium]